MATDAESVDFGQRVANGDLHPDIGDWYQALTGGERRAVLAYACYVLRVRVKPGQRRGQRLLRSCLPIQARAELKHLGRFKLTGSAGGRYLIVPRYGDTYRLERHGSREYAVARFCLHDAGETLPPADLSLAHFVMLTTDESGFLAAANVRRLKLQLWDGAWKRRLNAARRLRAQEAA